MSNRMRGHPVIVNMIGKILTSGMLLFALSLPADAIDPGTGTVEGLGALLYHDRNLSMNRTQSCATCHAPDHGFVDMRDNGAGAGVSRAVSLGDDGASLGDRNAPSLGYVGIIPNFHKATSGRYKGGFFLDGRAATLEEQAVTPLLNPAEMGMLERRAVVDRVRENPDYEAAFRKHYGEAVFDDEDRAYDALVASIAAFERSAFFRPFDSRYDRFLAGEWVLDHAPLAGLDGLEFFVDVVGSEGAECGGDGCVGLFVIHVSFSCMIQPDPGACIISYVSCVRRG